MAKAPYDLNESVDEFFTFRLFGKLYQFRHLTTEEMHEMQALENEKDKTVTETFLYKFITPVDSDTPQFKDIVNTMTVPMWRNFVNMIKTEFGT